MYNIIYMIDQASSQTNNQTPPAPTNPAGSASPFGAITSNPHGQTTPISSGKSIRRKKALKIIFLILVLAGLGVGAYYMFFKDKQNGIEVNTSVVVEDANLSNDGTIQNEEMLNTIDQRINSAHTDAERFEETMRKVTYLIAMEDYSAILDIANSISDEGLSDYDLFRLYNAYSTAYAGLGETANAERYQTLAEEAHLRDLSSFSVEE